MSGREQGGGPPVEGAGRAPVPELTDGTVTLRALRTGDLPAVVEQSRDALVRQWSLTIPSPYADSDARDFLRAAREGWATGERWQWALQAEGRFAGLVDLSHCGEGVREIGYVAHPGARGRGHVVRAARLALEHARAAGTPLVTWHAAVGNLASLRVAWHTGFRISAGPTRVVRRGVVREVWSADLVPGEPLQPAAAWVVPEGRLPAEQQPEQHPEQHPAQALPVPVPVVETARLRLRPYRDDDLPGSQDGPDDASRRFLPDGAHPDADAYPAWLARQRAQQLTGERLPWCVADRVTDRPLGYLALFRMEPHPRGFAAEVGYYLVPGARGRGLAAEALAAAVGHAFAPAGQGGLGLTRLQAGTDAENGASQAVLERVGFRRWGADRRSWRRTDGSLADGVHFELLASDPRP